MLTEHFIASVGVPTRPPGSNVAKDSAIFVQEYQPINAQRSVFKKSVTPPNCLAVSDSHVFAAQAEKAVVHVYSRDKGNHEASVPFTERITCIALACNSSILVLGTDEGRVVLWETASGRQVTSTRSHLQAVTTLTVDPTSNFLLSTSADSTVHIWSIPSLLSFSNPVSSTLRTFTSHNSKVIALVLGHSSRFGNIAISASNDKTCIIWDYFTNTVLRKYVLPLIPTALAVDAADRGIYIGYEDGSVQLVDFFESLDGQGIYANGVSKNAAAHAQSPPSSRWTYSDASIGATLCLSIPFDGCTVVSGHQSGVILLWDIARRGSAINLLQTALPGPVTNLIFLPVAGFVGEQPRNMRTHEVAKPRFGAFDSSSGAVPGNYALNFQLGRSIPAASESMFESTLSAPSFANDVVDAGLNELLTWGKIDGGVVGGDGDEDFMALDDNDGEPRQLALEEQNVLLKSELEALRRLQKVSFEKIEKINKERRSLMQREQRRLSKKRSSDKPYQTNGHQNIDEAIQESSSSSDER